MTIALSHEQQALLSEIAQATEKLEGLKQDLDGINSKLDAFSGQHEQYRLLQEICSSLDKLREIGAADLFWGALEGKEEPEQQLQRVRETAAQFQKRIDAILQAREAIQKLIQKQQTRIDFLHEDLLDVQEQEEREKNDYIVEREERALGYRPMVMPWSRNGEDERRFRKTLALVLLFTITFGVLVPLWELPLPDENEVVEIPEHLVKLVKKQKPKPPEKKPEEKPREKSEEKAPAKATPKPTVEQTRTARKKAESSGVLAFKDNFTDLLSDVSDAKLGAAARLSNKGAKASGDANRSLVMSQAKTTSGGINVAGLSRSVGGGAGKKLGGVAFSRVESGIGTDMGDERPLSDGPGPSRTDEEIQIVFDRYKAALYRIYNRELRKNPTLKGKMVLRITIEPDGSVSFGKVESTDLDSPELSGKIIARVKRFNFGPKEGVPTITILYPIDFLPAT